MCVCFEGCMMSEFKKTLSSLLFMIYSLAMCVCVCVT